MEYINLFFTLLVTFLCLGITGIAGALITLRVADYVHKKSNIHGMFIIVIGIAIFLSIFVTVVQYGENHSTSNKNKCSCKSLEK